MLTELQKNWIRQLRQAMKEGTYESFSTIMARHNAKLSRNGMNQEADYWKALGKHVYEPAFRKFVLDAVGVSHSDVEGLHFDFIADGIEVDLKLETSPFFIHHPTFTRTIDDNDVAQTGKNTDDATFYLWQCRVPGTEWRFKKGTTRTYQGPRLDVVCRTTVGEIRKLIALHGLEREPYKQRFNEELNSGNEAYRYVLDIRWFQITWRFENGVWAESSWRDKELHPPTALDDM